MPLLEDFLIFESFFEVTFNLLKSLVFSLSGTILENALLDDLILFLLSQT